MSLFGFEGCLGRSGGFIIWNWRFFVDMFVFWDRFVDLWWDSSFLYFFFVMLYFLFNVEDFVLIWGIKLILFFSLVILCNKLVFFIWREVIWFFRWLVLSFIFWFSLERGWFCLLLLVFRNVLIFWLWDFFKLFKSVFVLMILGCKFVKWRFNWLSFFFNVLMCLL